MAVINLGAFDIFTGQPPVEYTPFAYDQTQAYAIGAVFTATSFVEVFSYVNIKFKIEVAGQPAFETAPVTRVDIRPLVQLFYFPASSLFRGNGTCTVVAERIPVFRGGADGLNVNMALFYDDAVTVPSWRN